jgi:ribose-phosphate pyrophosphokinase
MILIRELDMKLIACNSNPALAQAIADQLKIPLCKAAIKRFSDMEVFVEILENVRGEDVFVIQSTCYPANDNMMELLVTLDALRRGSARRVTAVIPYFGYARQDRKTGPRSPISAKLVANIITSAGADRVLTMELHAGQIQGFFDIPLDNLIVSPVFLPHMQETTKGEDVVLVSPDVGGVVRARAIAKKVNADLAIIDKRREEAGVSEVMNVIGNVEGKTCILVDDIVDSAGTLCNAARALVEQGAKNVYGYVVHGVLSGPAVERITSSPINKLVITDSIPTTAAVKEAHNIEQVSVDGLMAEAILRIAEERSISALFR